MNMIEHIERSIDFYNHPKYDEALLHATIAVDIASRKWKSVDKSSGKIYKDFIRSYDWLIESFGCIRRGSIKAHFSGLDEKVSWSKNNAGTQDLADFIYHVYRCYSCHGEVIPADYALHEGLDISATIKSVNSFGEINGVAVQLPVKIIIGLLAACVFNKSSREIIYERTYQLTYDSSIVVDRNIEYLDDKVVVTNIVRPGSITAFPFQNYLGREDALRRFLSSVPKQEPEQIRVDVANAKKPMEIKRIDEHKWDD